MDRKRGTTWDSLKINKYKIAVSQLETKRIDSYGFDSLKRIKIPVTCPDNMFITIYNSASLIYLFIYKGNEPKPHLGSLQ